MGKIQVNDFIQSFAQKLRQTSGEDIQSFAGSRPKYPMAVVYLGKESAGIHEKLKDMLVRIWPPFRDELCFLGVGDDQRFFLIEGEEAGEEMEETQLRTEINRLFGLSTHFFGQKPYDGLLCPGHHRNFLRGGDEEVGGGNPPDGGKPQSGRTDVHVYGAS